MMFLISFFSAVCPYLALETCRQWHLSNKTVNLMRNGKMPTVSIEQAQNNYTKAVKAGLLKILSKMGISLLSSYCGAQIFEIYGLGKEVVDLAFKGTRGCHNRWALKMEKTRTQNRGEENRVSTVAFKFGD
ncbi:Ferredoxin-dependent glutamate synthase [Arachis hypogaea]|nr:Ferredoxin-dependent glutamate synthase [Arachis hypogaea]